MWSCSGSVRLRFLQTILPLLASRRRILGWVPLSNRVSGITTLLLPTTTELFVINLGAQPGATAGYPTCARPSCAPCPDLSARVCGDRTNATRDHRARERRLRSRGRAEADCLAWLRRRAVASAVGVFAWNRTARFGFLEIATNWSTLRAGGGFHVVEASPSCVCAVDQGLSESLLPESTERDTKDRK